MYTIYVSVKKCAYYLEDTDITLKSHHLPIKMLLEKKYPKVRVNSSAVKILPFQIKLKYIY